MEKISITQVSGSDSEYDVVEGLSTWEFIDTSDNEYDVVLALTDTDTDDDVTDASMESLNYLNALKVEAVETPDLKGFSLEYRDEEEECYYDDDEEEEDEDEDDLDDDDLDDELVPMAVRGKFGKERIKKLGKRTRMNKSKKLAYIFNRPGCVRGKHGLGVQHTYI